MTSLYAMTDEYREALRCMEADDIDDQVIADTLEALSGDIMDKGRNVAAFLQNLEVGADAIKSAEGRMAARRKVIENKVTRMKEYLRTSMEACDITEISCPEFVVKLGKPSAVCQIDDAELLPDDCVTTKTTTAPDKRGILRRLKDGEDIKGASLAYGKSKLSIK